MGDLRAGVIFRVCLKDFSGLGPGAPDVTISVRSSSCTKSIELSEIRNLVKSPSRKILYIYDERSKCLNSSEKQIFEGMIPTPKDCCVIKQNGK